MAVPPDSGIRTQVAMTNLSFQLENDKHEEITLSEGGKTFCHFKVDFGDNKKMELLIPSGPKLEAMLQMIHTIGMQTKGLSLDEFNLFKNDHTIGVIRFGAHENDDGSFETTLFRVNLHGTGLTLLFPVYKDLTKVSKEDQEQITTYAGLLRATLQRG